MVPMMLKGFMISFTIATGVPLLHPTHHQQRECVRRHQRLCRVSRRSAPGAISFAQGSSVTGFFTGRVLLRRARTAISTWDMQTDGETDLQSRQKKLQAAMTKLSGSHSTRHADLFYSKTRADVGQAVSGRSQRHRLVLPQSPSASFLNVDVARDPGGNSQE